jgi:hypothetical protein
MKARHLSPAPPVRITGMPTRAAVVRWDLMLFGFLVLVSLAR